MTDSDVEREVDEAIEQINELIVKNIIEYLKTEKFHNKTAKAYMVAYTIVYKIADDNEMYTSSRLLDYYKNTIIGYLNEACSQLLCEPADKLLEEFLIKTEKSKILIHWMRKVFSYLDKFHTVQKELGTLFDIALQLYFHHLFMPLKQNIINALNDLINEHRDGIAVYDMIIIKIIRIFKIVSLKDPVLVKYGEDFEWSGNSKNSSKGVLSDWFNNHFIPSTQNYISNKAKNEISKMSAPEYVKSCLKYLKEEDLRKNLFISKAYHNSLDNINNSYLIEANCNMLATVRAINNIIAIIGLLL